ncbi:MAG TPA: YihY/virulence factor BrkB family protein [Chthonomonadales bacterium]|nr:YihY/virulence factor BrkB family protein [Chthonomonadales bacterium]
MADAYSTHQCSLLACACAYCTLLSLVPLLLVGIAGLGFFLHSSAAALTEVMAAIRGYVPINPVFLRDQILAHVQARRGIIGLLGTLGLLYGAHQTFLAMEPAMNVIWKVPETRHWTKQRALAIVATLLTLVLLGANLAVSAAIAYVHQYHIALLHGRAADIAFSWLVGLAPVALTTILSMLLYQLLPARSVQFKPALLGALVTAFLWELTKVGFGLFVVYAHSYDRLYGGLSTLVILVVWTYYSMAILLLGADVATDYEFMRLGAAAAEVRAHTSANLTLASLGKSQKPAGEPESREPAP